MSYEKDKLDSYLTSASLSTALAPYVTSNSLSAALAGIDLSTYITSNSISAAVVTNTLTVRAGASVSATLSAGAVTVGGRPVGAVLLGYQTLSTTQNARFSGSWSDFVVLDLVVMYQTESGTNSQRPVSIFSDGGTTPFLTLANTSVTASSGLTFLSEVRVIGTNGRPQKIINASSRRDGNVLIFNNFSVTANTSFVNCISYSSTATMTNGTAVLYGWRIS